jgi:hypothetical protein
MKLTSTALAAIFVAAALCGCIDRANAPILVPVGSPAQPAGAVHALCVGDSNVAYDRSIEEFNRRAQMSGQYSLTSQASFDEIEQAKRDARMKYMSCVSSQGYKPFY